VSLNASTTNRCHIYSDLFRSSMLWLLMAIVWLITAGSDEIMQIWITIVTLNFVLPHNFMNSYISLFSNFLLLYWIIQFSKDCDNILKNKTQNRWLLYSLLYYRFFTHVHIDDTFDTHRQFLLYCFFRLNSINVPLQTHISTS
jgi:hypothetical protein